MKCSVCWQEMGTFHQCSPSLVGSDRAGGAEPSKGMEEIIWRLERQTIIEKLNKIISMLEDMRIQSGSEK